MEDTGTYTNVSAEWAVPSVTTNESSTEEYASQWVGIGGDLVSSLIQLGTGEESVNGTNYYYAWTENLPEQTNGVYQFSVSPGDLMSASISISGGVATLALTDLTTGTTLQPAETSDAYTGSLASAEVVQEAPSTTVGGFVLPLLPCSTFNFVGVQINGAYARLSSNDEISITQNSQGASQNLSIPSGPDIASYAFAVEYGGSTPSAPIDDETALETQSNDLWTLGTAGYVNWNVGLAAGTSPSITEFPNGYEVAVQTNTGDLWTLGSEGDTNWNAGMAANTSPSITPVAGGYELALQVNTGDLWTLGSDGDTDWDAGMAAGTSPSIAPVGSGYETALQVNTGDLWTLGSDGYNDWGAGMAAGTSPSIASVSGGFEVALQVNTGDLWTLGSDGYNDWNAGMAAGSSPSIATVSGGFEVALQVNTGDLWTLGSDGYNDWNAGMEAGTSPSITALNSGYEVALQANTGDLWTLGSAGYTGWSAPMNPHSSPGIA